ncbi:Uncharacterized membrane protein [Lutibacter oricola]|uniref:Uncharacterized membrane protein n=1 Tax=Lutibacter oricola TaxID=762486 RepID=A0A1H2W781_9FLAO|nr:hypothetical protein [Lutibacter oricola]SDW76512.1 Uncharacterized membrane protein [Lutibacter oricola]
MENQTVNEGKTMAIISYIWWIGLIIAYFMNNNTKNSFTGFHIRQSVGINLLSLAAGIISSYINGTVGMIISLGAFVFWIIALIGAIQGEEKKIPLLGDLFQDWFKGIA